MIKERCSDAVLVPGQPVEWHSPAQPGSATALVPVCWRFISGGGASGELSMVPPSVRMVLSAPTAHCVSAALLGGNTLPAPMLSDHSVQRFAIRNSPDGTWFRSPDGT